MPGLDIMSIIPGYTDPLPLMEVPSSLRVNDMKRSEDRILTTHTGSLPRSEKLSDLLLRVELGRDLDPVELKREVRSSIDYVVKKQLESGITVGNDGEQPRVGFSTYVPQRMSGFGGESRLEDGLSDLKKFPKYAEMYHRRFSNPIIDEPSIFYAPQAVGKLKYDDSLSEVRAELDAFSNALERQSKEGTFEETFMTAVSPGSVTTTMLRADNNPYYPSDIEYVLAVAKEMKKEYEYIVSRGHILQLDAPDLAMERQIMFQDRPLNEFLDRVELHVEALNVALENIPRDRARLHVCWGNWDGPHVDDVDIEPLLPLLYQVKVGALSMPFANPRHQHHYKVFKKIPLPESMILIPGVIDVTTNYVEHPEVVADRICQFVDVLGDRSRVIAGCDCGFGTFVNYTFVAEDVCWAKLSTLSNGAKIATDRLWD